MAKRVVGTVSVLVFILCPAAFGSEDSLVPNSLLGFLKPGMCIGVGTVQGSSGYTVYVYSRQDYDIARSVPSLPFGREGRGVYAQQVIDTHPAFQKRVDAFSGKTERDFTRRGSGWGLRVPFCSELVRDGYRRWE